MFHILPSRLQKLYLSVGNRIPNINMFITNFKPSNKYFIFFIDAF